MTFCSKNTETSFTKISFFVLIMTTILNISMTVTNTEFINRLLQSFWTLMVRFPRITLKRESLSVSGSGLPDKPTDQQ